MKKSHINRARRAGLEVVYRSRSVAFVDPFTGDRTALGKGSSGDWHSERAFVRFVKRFEKRNGIR